LKVVVLTTLKKGLLMENARLDPRVIRTRKLLRQSLIELVPEKGFSQLTIQDITDHATLNRATFYLHYRDKDELLLDVFEDLVTHAIPFPPDGKGDIPWEELHPIVTVFEHIAKYAEFYDAILGEQGVPLMMARLRNLIEDIINRWLKVLLPTTFADKILPDIATNFFGSAYLGVITWWLENDMPYTPTEMERFLIRISNMGIRSMITD
jgi:AcrR family transcriptional regulator